MSEIVENCRSDNGNEVNEERRKIAEEENAEEYLVEKELFVKMKKWYNSDDKMKKQYDNIVY